MYATIIAAIVFGVITFLAILYKEPETLIIDIIPISFCTVVLLCGYCNDFSDYADNKIGIETQLQNNLCCETIQKAINYNNDIEHYNSYWYRFTIEDRSQYKIDIDYYIELYKTGE